MKAAPGDVPVNSKAFIPQTIDSLEDHRHHFGVAKAIAFAKMKGLYGELNNTQKRLIQKNVNKETKIITDESKTDDEHFDSDVD